MPNIVGCRVCLANNVRMYIIANTELQEIYEKLTNTQFQTNNKPSTACYLCCTQLWNSQQLMLKALKAEKVFAQILNNEVQLSQLDRKTHNLSSNLCVTNTAFLSIDAVDTSIIKYELPITYEEGVLIKEESECKDTNTFDIKTESDGDNHFDPPESDSEDDLPLVTISKKESDGRVRSDKTTSVIKKKRKDDSKVFDIEACKILLSKEEQLQELVARSKSMNYLSSPFKCDLCYKGFVDVRAYNNHKEKHDESCGVHECEICRMRYRTARQARAHAAAAHARRYRCDRCAHTSHTANQARDHDKWHSGYTYECQLCSQKFRKPTSYLTHMRKRHPTEHICNICGESFVGSHGLLMHKSKTHKPGDENPEDPQEPASDRFCSDCNIQFVTLLAWKKHLLNSIKHSLGNESSAQCRICDQRFSNGISLSSHMKDHEKSLRTTTKTVQLAQLACEQCNTKFINRSKLQAHVNRIHLGLNTSLKYKKIIVCEVCGKKCTCAASLKYHQRTHTGERPYSCTTCSKRFPDKNQLRIHTRTHTGERPYCCAICDRRFSQKPALNRHYRVHTGVKPYGCQYCSRSFSQSNSLKLHVRTVHLKIPHVRKNKTNNEQDVVKQH